MNTFYYSEGEVYESKEAYEQCNIANGRRKDFGRLDIYDTKNDFQTFRERFEEMNQTEDNETALDFAAAQYSKDYQGAIGHDGEELS